MRTLSAWCAFSAAALALGAGATSFASDPSANAPLTIVAADEVGMLINSFKGTFAGEAEGSDGKAAVMFHGTPITVTGLENTLYFEIARADDPANPFRHGVMHGYMRQGQLTLRIFDLAGEKTLGDSMTGLWAAPESLPTLETSQLDPNMDVAITGGVEQMTGKTAHPFPTMLKGAVEMTCELSIQFGLARDGYNCSSFTFADRGYDAQGKLVWGPAEGTSVRFTPADSTAVVKKTDSGLVTITLVSGDVSGEALKDGGQIAVHYSGYLTDGRRFDTSRQEGRQPFKVAIPSQLIQGWNEGLPGIRNGERRRMVIPGPLAYGERGAARAGIGPNATLIFDIECLWLENAAPQPPAPETPKPSPTNPDSAIP